MSQFKIEPSVISGAEGQNKPQHYYDRLKNTNPGDFDYRKKEEKKESGDRKR